MPEIHWSQAVEALGTEYGLLGGIVTSLDADELLEPSGCRGWSNADLLYHMLLDAQRALVTFNAPAQGPADNDFVGYWRAFTASDDGSRAHARFVRISAAAHQDAKTIAERWHETAQAAVRNAGATSGLAFVTTQGHVLATADFIATLVVEACIHHLDLGRSLDIAAPAPAALSITTATLDGLLGAPRPAQWDELGYVLKATGRRPLDDNDRSALGDTAERLPLFS